MTGLPAYPLPEHPVATHDGIIWPLPRAAMTDPSWIGARLGEDVAALAATEGGVSVAALCGLGWPLSVLVDQSAAVLAAVRAAARRTRPPAPDPAPVDRVLADPMPGTEPPGTEPPDIGDLVADIRGLAAIGRLALEAAGRRAGSKAEMLLVTMADNAIRAEGAVDRALGRTVEAATCS